VPADRVGDRRLDAADRAGLGDPCILRLVPVFPSVSHDVMVAAADVRGDAQLLAASSVWRMRGSCNSAHLSSFAGDWCENP